MRIISVNNDVLDTYRNFMWLFDQVNLPFRIYGNGLQRIGDHERYLGKPIRGDIKANEGLFELNLIVE